MPAPRKLDPKVRQLGTHTFRCVDSRIVKHNQDASLVELWRMDEGGSGDTSLRITIRSNSYAMQSFAKIEAWTPNGWTLVWCIEGSQMITKEGLFYAREPGLLEFLSDRDELLRYASEVL